MYFHAVNCWCMSAQNVAQAEEPIDYTVIMFEDGTTKAFVGDLSIDQICDIYDKWEKEHSGNG